MKRLIMLMLTVVLLMLIVSGCVNGNADVTSGNSKGSTVGDITGNSSHVQGDIDNGNNTENLQKKESVLDLISYENGNYFLTLSISLYKLSISDYIQDVASVDIEDLKAAEASIIVQSPQEFKSDSFHIEKDDNGYLYLCREVIVELEPPEENGYVMGGCGYDHDHLFFKEKISSKPSVGMGAKLLSQTKNISSVEISTLPEGIEYSFSSYDAKKIVDYFSGLYLISDFPENPDEYYGMTYVVKFTYDNGRTEVIYLFGSFVRASNSAWYKLAFAEYRYFDDLLESLSE